MTDDRPNPDELLARVTADEARLQRGRLKIFFGYAAGVGKTFAMLQAAQRERANGVDVVVGYVEPHGRAETEALLAGLETLPFRHVPYHGVTLREFDLDAALARHPQLLLVDELAHSNADGLRHTKRWQDVDELLAAGINVYSTLNVQHVESLNDVIAQITGVVVKETLPDAVLENADEIELIDIIPDELIERLGAGKVYLAPQAERALQNFFQKSNLVALREISLRQTANRLRKDVEAARHNRAATAPWATNERLLVCVGPSPTTARLLRTAKRMSVAFGCEWLAVAVTTPKSVAQSLAARERVVEHLRLAERLGAETHTLVGEHVPPAVLEYARSRNVTKIVVGKTAEPWWRRVFSRGIVDQILEDSGDIDIYVIRGDGDGQSPQRHTARNESRSPSLWNWSEYLQTAAVVSLSTLVGWIFSLLQLAESNIVMVFLLGVTFVAARLGRGPAVVAAIASVLLFDFCFVRPFFSFAVGDAQYLLMFSVMLTIGLLISALTARIQQQLKLSQQQERRTAALFRLTRQLSELIGSEFLIQTAGRQLVEIFASEVVIYLCGKSSEFELRFGADTSISSIPVNAVVAQWVAEHNQLAGAGTDTLPNGTALFVPMLGSQRTVGTIGVKPSAANQFLDPEQQRLLETCASLVALAIERDISVLEVQQAQVQVETEQLRNSLLSSVSHDLRTPLAAMAGAANSLLSEREKLPDISRTEMLQSIVDESLRLSRLVDNLLDMTRLESGHLELNRQWHVIEELVCSALSRLKGPLSQHTITTDLPADLPLVFVDGLLLEQVFVNLLENAARHTPHHSTIEITARLTRDAIEIIVADNGPGLPPGTEERIFEKFFQANRHTPDGRRGVGLGLAICRAIIDIHGGRIQATNRASGGAEFRIRLPMSQPPQDLITPRM